MRKRKMQRGWLAKKGGTTLALHPDIVVTVFSSYTPKRVANYGSWVSKSDL